MQRRLIYFLYRLLGILGFPFILLYVVWRGLRHARYLRTLPERLGRLPHEYEQTADGAIWLHAVSVGEVLSAVQLLSELRRALPLAPVFVSTATLAGRALAEEKLKGLARGVFYAPLDYCFAVRRVLRMLRPLVVVVMETEIWPNLYREAKRAGCGLLVVNGRISDHAIGRYLGLRWFFRPVLGQANAILAQTEISRQRYLALGAPPERLRIGGNLKYDFEPRQARMPEAIDRWLAAIQPRHIWIAASTMPPLDSADVDEDAIVIEAYRTLAVKHPGLLLILVPRRPERFEAAAEKLWRAGVEFVRRSSLSVDTAAADTVRVLLVDSIGELSGVFPRADVVFMGGSLARRGGHNILEPAFFSRAIIVGPHMENFPEIAREFSRGGAMVEIREGAELASAVEGLLDDEDRRSELGGRARRLAEAQRGATRVAVQEIEQLYAASVPAFRRALPLRLLLWPLAGLWQAGSRWKRHGDLLRQGRLGALVVSIGGLTVGGAGKTPVVAWLAERLHSAGHRPAILTRGYRRKQPEEHTVLEPGAKAPAARTGDEAQIFLRSGVAAVGIGADRLGTGRRLEERFAPDVFLLDDGFQHHRLARDLDIVLIDALDPFGGGEIVPLGRLREPLAALGRADVFVVTRGARGRRFNGIEAALGAHHPSAPVFRARVVPECWVEVNGGRECPLEELAGTPSAAFCGLANPSSFWQTLTELGHQPLACWTFGDHHSYSSTQLRRLARQARDRGAEILLTTEKDCMNLGPGAAEIVQPLRLVWLRIGVEVDDEARLLALIAQRIQTPGRAASA